MASHWPREKQIPGRGHKGQPAFLRTAPLDFFLPQSEMNKKCCGALESEAAIFL